MTPYLSRILLLLMALVSGASHASQHDEAGTPLELVGTPQPVLHTTQLSPAEWAWLRHKETLVLGTFGPDFPPFRLGAESGEYTGITADYLTIVSRELGVKIEVRLYDTVEQAADALRNGAVDMLTTLSPLDPLDDLLMSDTFFRSAPVLVRRTNEEWAEGERLQGLKVAYNRLDINPQQARTLAPEAVLTPFTSLMDTFSSVAFGNQDAILSDSVSAYFLVNTYFANELQVSKILWGESPGGEKFVVNKQNEILHKIINSVIHTGVTRDQRDNISRRWSGGGFMRPDRLILDDNLQTWIKAHPKVRIGAAEHYPPQSYFGDDGHYYGISADLIARIQSQSGLNVEVARFATIDAAIEALVSGDIDMIADLSSTAERRKLMTFSRTYLTMPYAIVMRVDDQPFTSLSQLNGKTLALPQGYAMLSYLKNNYPEIKIIEVRDLPDSLTALAEGRADATLLPLLMARYYIARVYEHRLRVSMTLSDPLYISSFGMRRDSGELLAIINASLAEMPPDELSNMFNRWRSRVVISPPSWRSYGPLIYKSIGVAVVLLLGFLGWNVYLRKQIRERKRAERELITQNRFMEVLINGMPHPIYVCDADMRLNLYNDSYLDAMGLTRSALLASQNDGMPRVLGGDTQMMAAHRQVMETGEHVLADRQLSLGDEQKTVYHWMLPYEGMDGLPQGVIGGWIDISERRALVEELEQAKELADQASRTKTRFLATMSHEIRTPLNAVIGMLELALKRSASAPPDRASLEVAYQSARSLLALIGDILDVARIESGHLTLSSERTSLRQVAESTIRVFDGLARQKALELRLELGGELDQPVLVDPLRFRQVLSNLVSNAIKFTEQGQVTVSLTGKVLEDGYLQLMLVVADSGIGISAEDQKRLFQPFVQAKESSGGSGLGLMICRSLVKMMGGELSLESQTGIGTRVSVRLNLLQLESLPEPETLVSEATEQALPRLHVLVVDDHPANRQLLAQQLGYLGQRVESAKDGHEALASWRQHRFDLVITDCNMPGMNGYSLTRHIREEEQQSNQPPVRVLGCTANALPEQRQRCLDAGMNGCLFKPVELAMLASVISEGEPVARPTLPEEVFDVAELTRMTGGNPAVVTRLLTQMRESTTHDLAHLEQLLASGALLALDDLAHRVKGAAKIIKASRLHESCEKLEEACRGQETEQSLVLARQLATAMGELIQAIHHHLPPPPDLLHEQNKDA